MNWQRYLSSRPVQDVCALFFTFALLTWILQQWIIIKSY